MEEKNNENLSGDYIAGFVDGEGCFALKFRRDVKKNLENGKIRTYFYWGVEFAIVLRQDDVEILEKIKNIFKCGTITYSNGEVRFSIQNSKSLSEVIIPFFEKYKLHAKKAKDFLLWQEAVFILNKYRDGTVNSRVGKRGFIKKEIKQEDTVRLSEIRDSMITYKSKRPKAFKWKVTWMLLIKNRGR